MLGFYENFPTNIHTIGHLSASVSKRKIQLALIQMIYKLNRENFSLEDVVHLADPKCTVSFDFGIGEVNSFIYLNKEETSRMTEIIHREPFRVMDFFCAIRYYKKQKRSRTPLKSDYYMLRFTFKNKSVEIHVFHERGSRHVSPQEIIDFITRKINNNFSKTMLRTSTSS